MESGNIFICNLLVFFELFDYSEEHHVIDSPFPKKYYLHLKKNTTFMFDQVYSE